MLRLFGVLSLLLLLFLTPASFALVIDEVEMNLSDPDQRLINQHVGAIEGASATFLPIPVILQTGRREVDADLLSEYSHAPVEAFALTGSAFVGSSGHWSRNLNDPVSKCLVMLTPRGLLSRGDMRTAMLAHETFHCFQQHYAGSLANANRFSPWLLEGTTTFVGEDQIDRLTEEVGQFYLTKYATEHRNLFERSYDAFPFFAHLRSYGVHVYSMVRDIFTSADRSNEAAWNRIVSTIDDGVLSSWAMSYARKPEWGFRWDINIRDVSPARAEFPASLSDTGALPLTLSGVRGMPRHDMIFVTEDNPIEISIENGVGAIHIESPSNPAGSTYYLNPRNTLKFCYGAGCMCSGDSADPQFIRLENPIIYIAAASKAADHVTTVRRAERNCCNRAGQFDSRMVGLWEADVDKLLDVWAPFPEVPGVREKSGAGRIHIRITPDGSLVKTYYNIELFMKVYKGKHFARSNFWLEGGFSGCMRTRAIDDRKGWLYIENPVDSVKQSRLERPREDQRSTYSDTDGEWFQSAICAGQETCRGNFYFEGDALRFAGIGANGTYSQLRRIDGP